MQGFRKAIIISGAAMLLASVSPAHAKNVKAELAASKAEQAKLAKKTEELESEVGQLKSRLVTTAKTLRETEDSISKNDQSLKSLKERKIETLKGIQKDYNSIGGLVAAAGKYNRTSTAQMLLLSDPLQSARASFIMRGMLPEVNRHADDLKQQFGEMVRIENEISARLGEQSRHLEKINSQKAELAALLTDRKSLYGKTEKERAALEKEVARLGKEARNLAELEKKLREEEAKKRTVRAGARSKNIRVTAALPSSLLQPVAGPVQTDFGQIDGIGAKSEGMTFKTRRDAVVVTPLAGSVKFAGPFQKYKQILIIEHPGGYHSLIAGLGRIDTVVGAKLAAGEPVGSADSTQQDANIYYELRRGGTPINPRPLMVAQQKQDKKS